MTENKALTKTTSNALAKSGGYDELDTFREDYEKEKAELLTSNLQLKEGRNVVRVLPPVGYDAKDDAGPKNPFFRTWIHYIKNPADPDAKGKPMVCPLKTRQRPCLVCQEISRLRRTGSEADKNAADSLKATRHVYANAVDMNEAEKGVQIFRVPLGAFEFMISLLSPKRDASGELIEDRIYFPDPDSGYAIIIEKTGSGLKTKYPVVKLAQKPSSIKAEWLTQLKNLEAAIGHMDNDTIRAILEGKDIESAPESMAPGEDATDSHYDAPKVK